VATVSFRGVEKVYADGVRAVHDLDLEARDGELLALLGPSGCGKTTVLRLVAGLETPTRGEIHVGERRVDRLPPAERDVAMIFQDYALYPHKTVAENLAFPLRMRGEPRGERERRVREVAELLDLAPLLGKRPGHLSGGQQQRVAIGRALVREPAAFLMDEPLSNLDAQLRARIRTELGALQRRLGITTLFVTHDQSEAMTLGHRVAVMRQGRLHQVGTPDELYGAPADLFVASFVGQPPMNLVSGTLDGREGAWTIRLGEGILSLPSPFSPRGPSPNGRVVAGLRPEALRLVEPRSADALLNAWVRSVESSGPERIVRLEADLPEREPGDPDEVSAEITVRIPRREVPPRADQLVGVASDTGQIHVFARDGRPINRMEVG
jgi:multiple sugar transport system ATP-binding protein